MSLPVLLTKFAEGARYTITLGAYIVAMHSISILASNGNAAT